MSKRKFKITSVVGINWLTPINDDDLNYKWEKSSEINLVKKLTTKLTFINDSKRGITDFDFLYSLEQNIENRCEEILCEIFEVCKGKDVLEYTGIMPLKSGDWDLDQCKVSLSLEPKNDVYDCINDTKKDSRYPIATWCPYASGGPDVDTVCPEFFLYDKIGSDFVFINPSKVLIGGLTYYDKPYPYGGGGEVRYPHGMFAVMCYNIVQLLLYNCGREACLPMLKSDFFDWNAPGDTIGYIPSTTPKLPMNMPRNKYPNGIGGGGADGPGYCNRWIFLPTTPGINYYTGQTNKLTHMAFMPKSNANNNTASEWEEPAIIIDDPAGVYIDINANDISFEDIELIWATMFQAYWFIDTDGCMRVEHISWFNNNSIQYDTTASPHADLNIASRKYTYKDELLPRKETFLFSANRDKLNGAVGYGPNKNNEIIYDRICVSKNKENEEKSYSLPLVVTDIGSIDSRNRGLSDFYDNVGLNLFVSEFGAPFSQVNHAGNYETAQVLITNPSEVLLFVPDVTVYPNGHLQWANLIRRYLKDNRVLQQGLNGAEMITFNARTIKSKKQVPVYLQWCCENGEFKPNRAQIKTLLGIGSIDEVEFSTKKQLIKITTLHD